MYDTKALDHSVSKSSFIFLHLYQITRELDKFLHLKKFFTTSHEEYGDGDDVDGDYYDDT